MSTQAFNLLDISKFDNFINAKSSLLAEYDAINRRFESIKRNLAENWDGQGADAFAQDSQIIRTNIGGIEDALRTMCDTLIDCRAVYVECDNALGTANRSAGQ